MKWIVLIAIVVVILIIFGLWRRTQGAPRPAEPSRPVAPAAEAGVDEVAGAPAAETRPPGHPDGSRGADPDGWWPDTDETPRERS